MCNPFRGTPKPVHGGLAAAVLATGHPRNGQHIPLPNFLVYLNMCEEGGAVAQGAS